MHVATAALHTRVHKLPGKYLWSSEPSFTGTATHSNSNSNSNERLGRRPMSLHLQDTLLSMETEP